MLSSAPDGELTAISNSSAKGAYALWPLLVPTLMCICPLIHTQIHITENKVNLSIEERKANLYTEFLKYAFYRNLAQKRLFVVLGLKPEPRVC